MTEYRCSKIGRYHLNDPLPNPKDNLTTIGTVVINLITDAGLLPRKTDKRVLIDIAPDKDCRSCAIVAMYNLSPEFIAGFTGVKVREPVVLVRVTTEGCSYILRFSK